MVRNCLLPNSGNHVTLSSEFCPGEVIYNPSDACNCNEKELKKQTINHKGPIVVRGNIAYQLFSVIWSLIFQAQEKGKHGDREDAYNEKIESIFSK